MKHRVEQIRRRWWVVALVTVLALLTAGTVSVLAEPTYTAKSMLVLSGRTPDQDAVMVLGYLTIFNDPATIGRLKAEKSIPADVTVEAQTAATSPILTIEATASDPKVAQDSAQAMAEGFCDSINSAQNAGRDQHVIDLQRQLSAVEPLSPDGAANPYYASLQVRIDDAKATSNNELQVLQGRAGVSETAPNIVFNLVAGLFGGLLLGILAALCLAALSTRVTNSADLRRRAGVVPLVELPAAKSAGLDKLRTERLRGLANAISLADLPEQKIIVLTGSRVGAGARDVAESLARLSAQQGTRTALVYADNEQSLPTEGLGFNDALVDCEFVADGIVDGDVDFLKILPAGASHPDRYALATRERIAMVFTALRERADTVIVVAPSIASATETQLLCAEADVTILIVPSGSRISDVTTAADTLNKANAALLGAVFIAEDHKQLDHRPAPRLIPVPPEAPTFVQEGNTPRPAESIR